MLPPSGKVLKSTFSEVGFSTYNMQKTKGLLWLFFDVVINVGKWFILGLFNELLSGAHTY